MHSRHARQTIHEAASCDSVKEQSRHAMYRVERYRARTKQVFAHDGTHELPALVIDEILLALERYEAVMTLSHILPRDNLVRPTARHTLDGISVDEGDRRLRGSVLQQASHR